MNDQKQIRNALLAVIAAVAIVVGSIYVADHVRGPNAAEVQRNESELRDVLQWGCEYEGNPLRHVIQAMIREDIRGSAHVRPSYFPDIPPAVLHRLVHAQVAAKRRRLRRVRPVDCAAFYPQP